MPKKNYSQQYRLEAVKQVVDLGHPIPEVSGRLGIPKYRLIQWIETYKQIHVQPDTTELEIMRRENIRLRNELQRVKNELGELRKEIIRLEKKAS